MPLTQVDSGLLESGAALENIGTGNITPAYLNTQAQYTGFKNRIINGAMVIDQRNAGASVTPTSGQYTIDRWQYSASQTSKVTAQQNAGSVTPPAGYINYLGVTSTSAYSITSTDYFGIIQKIEGLNMTDFGWGTANAQTITLSFWVRSSLTGTFSLSLQNNGAARSYPVSYIINAANTWEQKTITIAGDTSGTWLTTNGIGIQLYFNLGTGATYSNTSGTWVAGNYVSTTGATSVVGTSGATFYITGVQLEKGSTATSFDYRPYGTELALCQRYYEIVSQATGYVSNTSWTSAFVNCIFQVQKRTAPSAPPIVGTISGQNYAGTNPTATATSIYGAAQTYGCQLSVTMTGATGTVSLGSSAILFINTGTGGFGFSAEL